MMQKISCFLKKHITSILLAVFIGLMFFSPASKAFVLRAMMVTGLFNAGLDRAAVPSPTFTKISGRFVDINGVERSFEELIGKVVFINYWASWCPPCRAELPSIKALYQHFKDNPDVEFILLCEDEDKQKGIEYFDAQLSCFRFYQAISKSPLFTGVLPLTVVLDKKGLVRYRHEGLADFNNAGFKRQLAALMEE